MQEEEKAAWEKNCKELRAQVQSGEIEYDNDLYIVEIDDLLFLVRGDLIPFKKRTGYDELEEE